MPRALNLIPLTLLLLLVVSACAAPSEATATAGCTGQQLETYLAQTEGIASRLEAVSPDAGDLSPLIADVTGLRRELARADVPECAQAAHDYLEQYADWTLVGLKDIQEGHDARTVNADFDTAAAMRARYLEALADL
jgi:hypothetical protein